MNRDDIKHWQAERICKALFPTKNYLVRLRRRMEQRRFPHDDPLYLLVCAAHEALNRLRLDVHYLSCGGTGPARAATDPMPHGDGKSVGPTSGG
jgi:hypothetical protein